MEMPSDIEMPLDVEATWLTLKMELPDVTYDELEEKVADDGLDQAVSGKVATAFTSGCTYTSFKSTYTFLRAIIVCYNIH